MKVPHVKIAYVALFALTLITTPQAQERTAGSSLETQMSWTALSAKADAAKYAAEAVDTRVNQIVSCGRKGLVYAPGESTADSGGCIKPLTDTAAMNQLNTKVNNVISCASQGRVFNGSSCSSGFTITGGGQCITPESGPGTATAWTIRSGWGDATGCEGGTPRCAGSRVLHIGYGTDIMGENEMSNFCKYSGGNSCHTQTFLCTQG